MLSRDPKKMANGVLRRAFGGLVDDTNPSGSRSGNMGNFMPKKAGAQEEPSFFGSPGSDSNFPDPDEDVQEFAEGGEVDEGKKVAAEEILSAMNEKDPAKLAMALHAFVEQCYQEEASEPEME